MARSPSATNVRSAGLSILFLALLVLVIAWFAGPFGNEETSPATPTAPATEGSAVQVSPADTPMRNPLADPAESTRN